MRTALTSPLVAFNPNPQIEHVRFAQNVSCFVIDNAVAEPEKLIELAVQYRDQLQPQPFNAYPGLLFPTPDEITNKLDEFFMLHIRSLLGARRTLRMHSRLSMVTLPPEQLEPRQSICHRDSQGVPDNQCIAASVLYLFKDEALGGTSFFVPKKSAHETALLIHDSGTMTREAFRTTRGIAPGYFTDSNEYFERVGTVPAKFNRMIFYDGAIFHSGDIAAPEKMSTDPAAGRLSLNGFFTCTRKAT
jgi:Family of unknown function (DUF6445)